MRATQPSPRLALLLLLPLLALPQGCSNSFAYVTRSPVISPSGGSFSAPVAVTLTDATPNAAIFYTLDGTTPTPTSKPYTAPFTLAQSATVQAIATSPDAIQSFVASAAFAITVPPQTAAPTFTPPSGTYTSAQSVTLTDTTPNATIYYTTNGTTPNTTSPVYTAPITVATSESISAIALAPGYTPSPVATAAYIIQPLTYTCANPGPGIICTVAGDGIQGFSGDNGPATGAQLNLPKGVARDSSGNLYIADESNSLIRLVTPAGVISTFAGTGAAAYSGDGGPATNAALNNPQGVALDSSGNLYIADSYNNRIRKITPRRIITTVAGTGVGANTGDGGPATAAAVDNPINIVVDGIGNLYFPDIYANTVRKVTPAGIISTVAGNGTPGYSGDGGPATSAQLNRPYGVAVDATGNLYITDSLNSSVRKVTPAGIISTVAGNGTAGYAGDGGPATSAELNLPAGIAVDSIGNVYIAEQTNARIRIVTPAGIISTAAGTGTVGYSGDGGAATLAELHMPDGVTVDSQGNLFIADTNNYRIREVFASTTAAPTFTPPAGNYITYQTVTITSTTPNATIYYTTNGTTPTTSSTVYTAPITVSTSETIEAIAIAPGYTPSPVATAAYTINIPATSCTNPGPGIICTVAGNGIQGYQGDGGPAITAELYNPEGVAVDLSGNLYLAEQGNNRVRKVTPAGIISTIAGVGTLGYSGDGGAAIAAQLRGPTGVALDSSGNLYIADVGNSSIRKVTPAGIISTVAGGAHGYGGDGGPATSAYLNAPEGVAVDSSGDLFIADMGNNFIRKVNTAGIISTFAGVFGSGGYSGDGGPATSAQLFFPRGVAVDGSGNVYIADTANNRIRKVTPAGIISTVAGNGTQGYNGDSGAAVSAELAFPADVAIDATGNLYIADLNNSRIRRVTSAGIISTVAGDGTPGFSGDGGAATSAELFQPWSITVDNNGNLFIADDDSRIREVFASATATPTFTPPAGTYATTQTVSITSTTPNATTYYTTNGTTPTPSSTVYTAPITVSTSETLEAIAIAPGYTASPVATAAYIIQAATPGSCAGLPSGDICTVAGDGSSGYSGDGGPATSAELFLPTGVAVDGSGNLYIADNSNNRIRKVTPAGIVSTVAGNGTQGYSGDGGLATGAQLSGPFAVTVDNRNNLYIADTDNHRIRKVTPVGIVSTVAGNGTQGYSGDGAAATAAELYKPTGVAVDSSGNLYIADSFNNRIRMVTPAGIISTVAGSGTQGYSGDGGPATAASFYVPFAVAVDSSGNLYIADSDNCRIRKVTPAGIISTVAGDGSSGYSGDGGSATAAELRSPRGIAVDSTGNLYIADTDNYLVRKVTASGIISTVAGNILGGYNGDGGPATGAELFTPYSPAVDSTGNLYIADSSNNRIRKVIH